MNYEEDSKADAPELGEVLKLVDLLQVAEEAAEKLEAELKIKKEDIRRLSQESIPAAMQALGYKEVTVKNGTEISLKKEVYCSFAENKRPAALEWLEKNNYSGIIKSHTEVYFEKGEDEKRALMERVLKELEVDYKNSRTVHPQTLKAFLKERIAAGTNIDLQVFGAVEVIEAKIKKPKKDRFTLDE